MILQTVLQQIKLNGLLFQCSSQTQGEPQLLHSTQTQGRDALSFNATPKFRGLCSYAPFILKMLLFLYFFQTLAFSSSPFPLKLSEAPCLCSFQTHPPLFQHSSLYSGKLKSSRQEQKLLIFKSSSIRCLLSLRGRGKDRDP